MIPKHDIPISGGYPSQIQSRGNLMDIPKYSPSEIWILGFGYSVNSWLKKKPRNSVDDQSTILPKVSENRPIPI